MRTDDDPVTGRLEPVRGRMGGRGLPLPPLVPLVAIVALLAGVSAGYGLAPRPAPEPSPAPLPSASPLPSVASATATQPPIDSAPATPISVVFGWDEGSFNTAFTYDVNGTLIAAALPSIPAGGVSLATALANKGYPIDPKSVVAARIVPYSMIGTRGSSGFWVWAIVVRGPGSIPCRWHVDLPTPDTSPVTSSPPCQLELSYQTVVVDYTTGIWLETDSGYLP